MALFKCTQSLNVSEVSFLEKVIQDNHKQKFKNLKCDVYDE